MAKGREEQNTVLRVETGEGEENSVCSYKKDKEREERWFDNTSTQGG